MTIQILKKLPIINGYVRIPGVETIEPFTLTVQQVLDHIPGSYVTTIDGTDYTYGLTPQASTEFRSYDGTKRPQRVIVLPAFTAPSGYGTDWYDVLRDAASTV